MLFISDGAQGVLSASQCPLSVITTCPIENIGGFSLTSAIVALRQRSVQKARWFEWKKLEAPSKEGANFPRIELSQAFPNDQSSPLNNVLIAGSTDWYFPVIFLSTLSMCQS